jgi:transposase
LNPKSVDRYRDRYRVSGAKDDSFDAMVIANILRTDRHMFKPILPDSTLLRELRILTHDQQHLIQLKTKLVNQIQSCLKDFYPIALQLFTEIDQGITVNFLLNYPTPKIISVNELRGFLQNQHYPKAEEKAQEIHKELSASQLFVEDFVIRTKSRLLVTLVDHLKTLIAQLAEYQKEIDRLFEQHPDKDIFISLPGSGEKNAPRLLAEIGDNKERYLEAKNLRCEAGTAPITVKSGKTKIVKIRFACRKFLRNTMYQFSFYND